MSLKDLTRESVLAALAEHDEAGDVAFLERHGFDSGDYLVVHAGKRYASKAIAGVAHGYATGEQLSAAAFSGGTDTVRPALERLGFEVVRVPRRNPIWAHDEVVLACDLVVDNGWRELRTEDTKVQRLSELLRSMTIHPLTDRLENFRSPDAVSCKTTDLATAHPDYPGVRTRDGRVDREVIQEFIIDPARMAAVATSIRAAADASAPRLRRSGVGRGLTLAHVEAALRAWWSIGRDAFMRMYGGRPAERYVVVTETGDVDALALLIGARALAGMDTAGSWRGDRDNVAQPFRELGYHVGDGGQQSPPEVAEFELTVHGSTRPSTDAGGRGQGFMLDQYTKMAVEAHAMNLARQHHATLGTVLDTSLRQSWDYRSRLTVVAGTSRLRALPVTLVKCAPDPKRGRPCPELSLRRPLHRQSHRSRVWRGRRGHHLWGRAIAVHPWKIDDGQRQPLGYKYRLPDRLH